MDFRSAEKQRFEKGKPHQVVPVAVCEKKIVAIAAFFDEMITQPSDAGSGINDDDVIAVRVNGHAGGIPSIRIVSFSGNGY